MTDSSTSSPDRTLFKVGAFFAALLLVALVADLARGTGGAAWLFGVDTTAVAATEEELPDAATGAFVVRGALLFDGREFHRDVDVLVRDGMIAEVGQELDVDGAADVYGSGRTLMPGLIDAHTHTWGDALRAALAFGVTAELDMFTDPGFASSMRAQQAADGAPGRADLFSTGYLVTAPGGHGTEYGMEIPTLERAEDAAAFVQARVDEGADFIKIVYDDGSLNRRFNSLDLPTVTAVIEAAHAHDKLAVVHVARQQDARDVVEAGADGIVHVFYDSEATAETVATFVEHGAFVIPTLAVLESVAGGAGGAELLTDPRVAPYVTGADRANLETGFPGSADRSEVLDRALASVAAFHAAGVPILAGTDAPNPGTAHGSSLHRELELLARAGLDPAAVLRAATSLPASTFGLERRGLVEPGARADLVLVVGDVRDDVTLSRDIEGIWKGGERFDREAWRSALERGAETPDAGDGALSDFDGGALTSTIGSGWQISTDEMMGGSSTATMQVVDGGADGSAGALEVTGNLVQSGTYAWAGPMLMVGTQPFAPADLSAFTGLSFWLRGEGTVAVMIFSTASGQLPAVAPVTATAEWSRHELDFAEFAGVDPSGLQAVMFSPLVGGEFTFGIDELRLR